MRLGRSWPRSRRWRRRARRAAPMARPMPRDAPVMNRVLPLSDMAAPRKVRRVTERYSIAVQIAVHAVRRISALTMKMNAWRTKSCRRAAPVERRPSRRRYCRSPWRRRHARAPARATRSTKRRGIGRDVHHARRRSGVQEVVAVEAHEHEDQQAAGARTEEAVVETDGRNQHCADNVMRAGEGARRMLAAEILAPQP